MPKLKAFSSLLRTSAFYFFGPEFAPRPKMNAEVREELMAASSNRISSSSLSTCGCIVAMVLKWTVLGKEQNTGSGMVSKGIGVQDGRLCCILGDIPGKAVLKACLN